MPDPIRKSIIVPCGPERAFEVFTSQIGGWWPFEGHSISEANQTKAITAAFEPHIGGRLFETAEDGREFDWGRVEAWEPGQRLHILWLMGREPGDCSEVEILFTADGPGCRVDLEHRNWDVYGAEAQLKRDSYVKGWNLVFGTCFSEACRL